MVRRALAAGLAAAAVTAGCGPGTAQTTQGAARGVAWRPLGSWSGRGSLQTESFTSETGALRPPFGETKVPAPGPRPRRRVSPECPQRHQRPHVQQVVEQAGAGSGVGYLQSEPRVFYVVVDSNQLSWTFTVEEAIGYP